MITEYIRFYKKKGEFVPDRILGAEDVFDEKWKDWRLRGKKDLRFQLEGRKRWIMETKTYARIVERDLLDKLPNDIQCLFYSLAEQLEYDLKVYGVLYNIIRNPGHKLGKDETLQQFCNRLRKAIRKDPNHFFKRFEIPFTKADINEFKKELDYKIKDMAMVCSGETYPYRNETACVAPFRCDYLIACSTGSLNGYIKERKLFKELL